MVYQYGVRRMQKRTSVIIAMPQVSIYRGSSTTQKPIIPGYHRQLVPQSRYTHARARFTEKRAPLD